MEKNTESIQTELTHKQLAKIFMSGLHLPFICENDPKPLIRRVAGLTVTGRTILDNSRGMRSGYPIEKCKLCLTPLSQITDEHAIGAANVVLSTMPKGDSVVQRLPGQGNCVVVINTTTTTIKKKKIRWKVSISFFRHVIELTLSEDDVRGRVCQYSNLLGITIPLFYGVRDALVHRRRAPDERENRL